MQECLWQREECAASLIPPPHRNAGMAAALAHQMRPPLDAASATLIYPECGPEVLTLRADEEQMS